MKNKRFTFLIVSFCIYLLATSFIGTIGTPVTAYADGDPFPPPPDSIPEGGKTSDTTLSGPEENRQENEMSILDMLLWLVTVKI